MSRLRQILPATDDEKIEVRGTKIDPCQKYDIGLFFFVAMADARYFMSTIAISTIFFTVGLLDSSLLVRAAFDRVIEVRGSGATMSFYSGDNSFALLYLWVPPNAFNLICSTL